MKEVLPCRVVFDGWEHGSVQNAVMQSTGQQVRGRRKTHHALAAQHDDLLDDLRPAAQRGARGRLHSCCLLLLLLLAACAAVDSINQESGAAAAGCMAGCAMPRALAEWCLWVGVWGVGEVSGVHTHTRALVG